MRIWKANAGKFQNKWNCCAISGGEKSHHVQRRNVVSDVSWCHPVLFTDAAATWMLQLSRLDGFFPVSSGTSLVKSRVADVDRQDEQENTLAPSCNLSTGVTWNRVTLAVDISVSCINKTFSCRRETARCFVSLNMDKSFKITQRHSKWHT